MNRGPKAVLQVRDPRGTRGKVLSHGRRVTIKRNGVTAFPGVILNRKRVTGAAEETVRVDLVHEGYRELQKWPCDGYVFDEDGNPRTSRDAVFVNPWRYTIHRLQAGTLDEDGLGTDIDGVTVDEAARCLIGTKFVMQHDYQDNTPFLPSQVYASTNKLQVYADDADARNYLQRVRKDGSSFYAGSAIESIPLENGDPNVRPMGTISFVDVLLLGILTSIPRLDELNEPLDPDQHPTVRVCRNARSAVRTYSTVDLVHTSNYNGSGLDAWTGRVNLSEDGASTRDSLGYEVTIPGYDGDASTTQVQYAKLTCTTTPDAGVTEAEVHPYADPQGLTGSAVWVEDDYQGLSRAEALERLRKSTIAAEDVTTSPHWDMWVDADLGFHFKERRGSDLNSTYSHKNHNITLLEREEYGDNVAFQTIAVGGGKGTAEIMIVDQDEFIIGGLYDSDRDPLGETQLYGILPKVYVYRDNTVTSRSELRRRARAAHRFRRDPHSYHKVRFIGFQDQDFETGDGILLDEPNWDLEDEQVRIAHVHRAWTGGSEDIDVELGHRQEHPAGAFRTQRITTEQASRTPVNTPGTIGVGGPGVYFDKDNYGRFAFNVPEGVEIERVFLSLTTLPWQTTSRAADPATIDENNSTLLYTDTENGFSVAAAPAVDMTTISTTSAEAGASTTITDYDGLMLVWFVNTSSVGGPLGLTIELRDQSGNWQSVGGLFFPYAGASPARRLFLPSNALRSNYANFGLGTQVTGARIVFSNNGAITSVDASLQVYGIIRHTHELDFGIYQFDGDDGDGTGSPIYGEDIMFAVDPSLNGVGQPTSFAGQRHPGKFGSRSASRHEIVDVTGYLGTMANGVVSPGEHLVYFLGTTQSDSNEQGLSVVSVNPIFKIREGTR